MGEELLSLGVGVAHDGAGGGAPLLVFAPPEVHGEDQEEWA